MSKLNNTDWLAVVTCDGQSGLGEVLGYVVGSTEQEVNIPRGELFDALDLFIHEEIPDDVYVEYCTAEEFLDSYGDRMPLGNNGLHL